MRILLIRTSALGDVVHGLPVLTALRRHHPDATIGWIVEETLAPLLEGHPDLDEVLAVRLRSWRRPFASRHTTGEIRRFLGRLRDFGPEIVIDLMGNHKAGVLAALTLADRRIGPARRDRREPSSACWINEPVRLRGRHVVERTLSLLAPLGVPGEPPDFGGDKLLPDAAPPPDLPRDFFVVHPGAAWPNKRYPAASWGDAARELAARTGLRGLVVHGPGEAGLTEVALAAGRGALEHVATDDLGALAALLRRARLVLGGDTGPLHLARALGTPVLCLMGPTDPATHGPYGQPEAALWRQLPCSFCHRRFGEPKACLTTLPPSAVVERAASLARTAPESP